MRLTQKQAMADKPEPFGYFRAEPFGWTDCAPTDEGARPLYEAPVDVPHFTEQEVCDILSRDNPPMLEVGIVRMVERLMRERLGLAP